MRCRGFGESRLTTDEYDMTVECTVFSSNCTPIATYTCTLLNIIGLYIYDSFFLTGNLFSMCCFVLTSCFVKGQGLLRKYCICDNRIFFEVPLCVFDKLV
jgi:hypothetical protein